MATDALSKCNTAWQSAGKNIKTPYFRTYSRVFDLSKLCMVVEDVETILRGDNHFSILRIVFATGCTEKFGLMTDAQFLSNNSVTCEGNHVKFNKLVQDRWAHKSS